MSSNNNADKSDRWSDLADIDWDAPTPPPPSATHSVPPFRPYETFDLSTLSPSGQVDWATAPPTYDPPDTLGFMTILAAAIALQHHAHGLAALLARCAGDSGAGADARLATDALRLVGQIDTFLDTRLGPVLGVPSAGRADDDDDASGEKTTGEHTP